MGTEKGILHLITRYNEYTNDLEIIGISTNRKRATEIVLNDFENNGISQFRKVAGPGQVSYSKEHYSDRVIVYPIIPNSGGKTGDRILTYTITSIEPDVPITLSKF